MTHMSSSSWYRGEADLQPREPILRVLNHSISAKFARRFASPGVSQRGRRGRSEVRRICGRYQRDAMKREKRGVEGVAG